MAIKTYLSNLAEKILWLNGKAFSFEMFPPKRVIYDDPSSTVVQKTSRQVGKSTDIAATKILNCVTHPHFTTMYVAPQSKHKSDFSHQKLSPLLEGSPFVKHNYLSARLVNNVDYKQFLNGSSMLLKYAYLTDLPLRGPSTDYNFWDEFQEANPAIFPVGQETLNRSIFKKTMITGTPKSTLTPLHKVWISSNQTEVFYKCMSCNTWNLPGLAHIQANGVCCEKCGTLLTAEKWEWVMVGDPNSDISGYHYNKLGLAIFKDIATDWKKDVWNKLYGPEQVRISLRQFKNEVLGEEDDESIRPITIQDIMACCDGKGEVTGRKSLTIEDIENGAYSREDFRELDGPVFCAIDWGTTNTVTSNTVLILGTKKNGTPDVIKVFLIKRFVGDQSSFEYILNYVYNLYRVLPNLVFFAADNGMGSAPNSLIRNKLGPEKLFGFQFVPNQKEKFKWHVVVGSSQEQYNAYYTVSKVKGYDQFFYEIKDNLWDFPSWHVFKEYSQEILNVEQEFNEDKNKYIYTHAEQNPDDVPSALIYLRSIIELSEGLY